MAREPMMRPTWERHLQTALMTVAVALIAWVGSSLLALLTSVARFEVKMDAFQGDIAKQAQAMHTLAQNSATKAEHDRDMVRVGETLTDHEQRIRRLEHRVPPR